MENLIIDKAIEIIFNDKTQNLSKAIYIASEDVKPYKYKLIQDQYGLLKFKPENVDRSNFWFDFDESGQNERIKILTELKSK